MSIALQTFGYTATAPAPVPISLACLRHVICLVWLLSLAPPPPLAAHSDLHLRITALSERLAQEPGNAALYLKRGDLHHQHQDWSAALQDFDHAARLDSSLSIVELYRGLTYLAAGRPEAARSALEHFLAHHPAHAEALTARARALAQLGNPLAAVADFTRALALLPTPDVYLERAGALAAAGATYIDEALRGLDEGLTVLGSLVVLQQRAIELELQRWRSDAALARLDQLAATMPRQEIWLARRGEILEQAGRPDAAREQFIAALAALEALPRARRQTATMAELETRLRTALVRLRDAGR